MKQLIFALLLTISLNANTVARPLHPRTTPDKAAVTRLEQMIPHLMSEAEIPGLSIALIRDSKMIWSHGFGVTNSETKAPVNASTVFEAASLTKPVFAYAVLKLVDSGKLDLDTPLVKYLPGRYDVGDDPRLDQITARHVLSHTTGFPNWRPRGAETLKMYFVPGHHFSYSGEGFVYLSRVVEHITGEPTDAFVKRTVFDPLEMKSSSMVWRNDYESLKTFTHDWVGGVSGRGKPEKANAAASLHTTANDYANFVIAMLKGTGLKPKTAQSHADAAKHGHRCRRIQSQHAGAEAREQRFMGTRLGSGKDRRRNRFLALGRQWRHEGVCARVSPTEDGSGDVCE